MSLVELLISMSVLAILIASFAALLQTTVTRSSALTTQMTLQSVGRSAIDSLAADLRQAVCLNSTAPIVAGSGTTLTFYSPDRQVPYHMREIFYTVSNSTLTRQIATSPGTSANYGTYTPPWGTPVSGTAGPVVDSITNAIVFTFYDSSANPISTNGSAVSAGQLPNIANVRVSLTLAPKGARGSGLTTVEANISLRTPTCNG